MISLLVSTVAPGLANSGTCRSVQAASTALEQLCPSETCDVLNWFRGGTLWQRCGGCEGRGRCGCCPWTKPTPQHDEKSWALSAMDACKPRGASAWLQGLGAFRAPKPAECRAPRSSNGLPVCGQRSHQPATSHGHPTKNPKVPRCRASNGAHPCPRAPCFRLHPWQRTAMQHAHGAMDKVPHGCLPIAAS